MITSMVRIGGFVRFVSIPRSLLLLLILSALAACSSGGSSKQKVAQIAVWEDEGWTADGQLTRMLFDGNAEVRVRAALALARVNDTLANDSIGLALKIDKEPAVRKAAAFALGMDRWRKGGADLLEALAKERDEGVLREILMACGRVYTRDEYQQLMPFLRHNDPSVREQALITLDLINRHDIADSIVPFLSDPNPAIRWAAHFALVRANKPEIALLAIPACSDTSVALRHVAHRMLGAANTEEATATLLKGLEDPSVEVRAAAAEAFALNTDTLRIRRVYPYLATETDPRVLKSLANTIAEHWRAEAEPYLKPLLKNPDPGVRAAAVRALAHRLDFDFAGRIAPAATDPDPLVRIAYLETIDEIIRYSVPDTTGFMPQVRSLMSDPIPRVRARAVQSYVSLGGAGATDALNRLYHDPDPACLHMAINLIGSFRVQPYQDSLHALYQEHRDEWRPDIKWAILASTANLSPSVHADSVRTEILNWGMADPNRHVRWYTIAVWEKFRQDRRAELGTYKTDLTVDNIDQLLHPYPSNPSARVVTTKGTFTIELFADKTPRYVRRFIELVREGTYDNTPVNDVQVGGVVHLGDRRGDGFGMAGISVRDEYRPDRLQAGDLLWLINTRDSGMGLFAIATDRLPYLDWRYGVFAHVTDGFDVVRNLQLTDTLKTIEIVIPAS